MRKIIFSLSLFAGLIILLFSVNPLIKKHFHEEDTQELHHEEFQPDDGIIALNEEQIVNHPFEMRSAGPGELDITLTTRGKNCNDPDRLVHIIPKVPGIAKEAKQNIGTKSLRMNSLHFRKSGNCQFKRRLFIRCQ